MLTTPVQEAFDAPDWVFETKWDGLRLVVEKKGGAVTAYTRNGVVVNERYPSVVKALLKSRHDFIIDGELVVLDARGVSRFQLLQNALKHKMPITYQVFDLLALDGRDLRSEGLLERKATLKKILPKSTVISYSAHTEGDGVKRFKEAKRRGEEGIIGKRAHSAYHSGTRTRDWVKIKTSERQEAVIVGFTKPQGSRTHFGALVLAVREGRAWRYCGHVGTGFTRTTLKELHERMVPLIVKKAIVALPAPEAVTWVRPELIAEIKFTEWTSAGEMRQPTYIGLREDKRPEDVVAEHGEKVASIDPGESAVSFTHLDKVYWPQQKYTKKDLIAYYRRVAPALLSFLKDRPLVITRYPEGIDGPHFYQKNVEPKMLPSFVQTRAIPAKTVHKIVHYVVCDNVETLLFLANMGAIEVHMWGSRAHRRAHPDVMVFDLDPGSGVSFPDVIGAAHALKAVLDACGVESFVKTSGKRGLHVLVGLQGAYPYAKARAFARRIAELLARTHPKTMTAARGKEHRHGKIFVDYLRNAEGQTIIIPFGVRAVREASISMPLAWSSLSPDLDPASFTIKSAVATAAAKKHLADLLKSKTDLDAASKQLSELEKRAIKGDVIQ
jgi:bifunctional non-homologous end joining protein LigD